MPVYTEYARQRRWQPAHLSDIVPWRALVAPGVVLQKERYGLQRTYAVRGPDLQGETPEVQGALMLQANAVLKRLGGRWMLHSEAQRAPVPDVPVAAWTRPIPALIDQERREALLTTPGSRQTAYFLTLTWYPPSQSTRQGLQWLLHGPDTAPVTADGLLEVAVTAFVAQA